jgi:hypothetical protein
VILRRARGDRQLRRDLFVGLAGHHAIQDCFLLHGQPGGDSRKPSVLYKFTPRDPDNKFLPVLADFDFHQNGFGVTV